MKVLVVDDDAEILRMMARVLQSRGHTVETCHGPFGASAQVLRLHPDVVLMDVMMPALDGASLLALLEKLELKPRPIMVLWSADDDTVARLGRELNQPVLSKRGNPTEVAGQLEKLAATR